MNGFAIASLVLGIIGVVILSVIFGIIALVQIPKRGQRGRGLAIAGLVTSGCWVAVSAAVLVTVAILAPGFDPVTGDLRPGHVTPDKLNVGDCIESLPADEVIITVHVVPCSELHGGRVFATFELPGGKWPGEAEVNASADAGCTSRFDASGEHADQLSEIVYLAPLERGWRLGDREVLCFLVPAG